MKRLLLLCFFLVSSIKIFAQREVSGIVKDSTDNSVIAASVTLTSAKDTLKTVTNADGIFIFKNVQAGQFLISVKSLGFANYNKRFLYSDATKRLVLDPIVMKSSNTMLSEVKINGTPAITYKEDTVEYRASDYKVRENATVDELLKKMEGVEVGTDGSVTFQGQTVTKARLNGKDYSGGDVANAIQNLPAEIIEKAQFVDDYGDQAARTGIKDGEPQKVLNLTTKANRSVGNLARINAGAGSNERVETNVWGQRMSGNRVLTASTGLANTVLGIAGGGNAGFTGGGNNSGTNQGGNQGNRNNTTGNANSSSFSGGGGNVAGGTSKTGNVSFGYRDKINPKMDLNTGLSFRFNNNNSTSNSITETFLDSVNTLYTQSIGGRDVNSQTGNLNLDWEYDINKSNYLRIQPTVTYTYSLNGTTSNRAQSLPGRNRQLTVGANSTDNTTPSFGGSLLYQHLFAKKGRNFSLNVSYTNNRTDIETNQDNNILYYNPSTTDDIVTRDSLIQRIIMRKSLNNTLRASSTISESLSAKSRVDFNAQVNRREYDNKAFTDNTLGDQLVRIDSLSNVFNYSFTETRLSLNYRFTQKKYNFSLGVTAIPTILDGQKQKVTGQDTSFVRTNFFIIPIARLEYQFSRQHRLSLNYTGNAQEPSFDQIQPVRDVSNVNNTTVGNPNLKAAFNHTVNFAYNNYIANSRLNYSVSLNARFVENAVVSNSTVIGDRVLTYETSYVNVNGIRNYSTNYNLSKSFADRKYSLRLNGTISQNHGITFSRASKSEGPNAKGQKITSESWNYNQRLSLQINPSEKFEFNPNVSFVYTKADYSVSTRNTWSRRWAFTADGRVYLQKTTFVTFSASQNFTSGLSAALVSNPLIINSSIQKQFFKRKNGTLGLQVFDLLKQNNFNNLTVTSTGRTQTQSNALSRYFMINFRWTPSKWSGTPTRNGRQMMRRGDGSFY